MDVTLKIQAFHAVAGLFRALAIGSATLFVGRAIGWWIAERRRLRYSKRRMAWSR